ncbi:hypothetical protein ScPMuIL_008199 [Solemya velum]
MKPVWCGGLSHCFMWFPSVLGSVPFHEEYTGLSCSGFHCVCNVDDCKFGEDPCVCRTQKIECPSEHQLDIITGNCEPCPPLTHKPSRGCGPCVYDEQLWRESLEGSTSTPIFNTSAGTRGTITSPKSYDNVLEIILPILLSLLVSGIIGGVCLYHRKKRQTRRRTARQSRELQNRNDYSQITLHGNTYNSFPVNDDSRQNACNHQITEGSITSSTLYETLPHTNNVYLCYNGINHEPNGVSMDSEGTDHMRVAPRVENSGRQDLCSSNGTKRSQNHVPLKLATNRSVSQESDKPIAKVTPTPKNNLMSPGFLDPQQIAVSLQQQNALPFGRSVTSPNAVCARPIRPVFSTQFPSPTDMHPSEDNSTQNSASTSPKLNKTRMSKSNTKVETIDSHHTNPKYLDTCGGNSETHCREIASSSLPDSGIEETGQMRLSSNNQGLAEIDDEVNSSLLERCLDEAEDSESGDSETEELKPIK